MGCIFGDIKNSHQIQNHLGFKLYFHLEVLTFKIIYKTFCINFYERLFLRPWIAFDHLSNIS